MTDTTEPADAGETIRLAPIKDRIAASIRKHGGRVQYYHLARDVFPTDQFPNAWGYPTRGGPPGCYMALSRAIDRHGFYISYEGASNVVHSHVMMGRAMKGPTP